jgi:hypothetical protein
MLEPIEVMGRRIGVRLERAPIRNSYARVRGDFLVIRLPERMSERRAMKTAEELHGRALKALQKDPNRFMGMPDISFNDKDTISILGERLAVNIVRTHREKTGIRLFNGALYVNAPELADKGKIDRSIRDFLERMCLPSLREMVEAMNARHFRSELGPITLRDNLTLWGSCTPQNKITLNFRLLSAPSEVLEYVMVHELAHTKVRNHSKRFWTLVSSIIPDYGERRRWLRRNSHGLKPAVA